MRGRRLLVTQTPPPANRHTTPWGWLIPSLLTAPELLKAWPDTALGRKGYAGNEALSRGAILATSEAFGLSVGWGIQ